MKEKHMTIKKTISILMTLVLLLSVVVPGMSVMGTGSEAHSHSYGQWVFDAENGTQSRTCGECGDAQILHGTDTMAFTASALSFMLEDLSKPVILTGSQLPIGKLRTDGKENLITAIEIAAAKHPDGTAIVPEVCIFFENHLLRGNRTTKINAENFNAFRSYNYPLLATAGIHIKYEYDKIHKPDPTLPLKPYYLYDTNVIVLTLFPGIQENIIQNILNTPGLRAVVLKTYGSGNAPQKPGFIKLLKEATERGIVIVNISQCATGMVEMGRYETGLHLLDAGVISGYDSTVEALITKLMFLLGHGKSDKEIRELMNQPIAGEFTKI